MKKVSYSLLILLLLSTVFTFSSTPSFAKSQAPVYGNLKLSHQSN
ncbi:hypothetical protein ACQKDB_17200 [Planococcus kocurii]